jgi:diacylglycerol O-acyltransferase
MPSDPSRRLNEADSMFLTVERAAGATYAPVTISVLERSFDDEEATAHLQEVLVRLLPAMHSRIAHDRLSTALPRWVHVPGFEPESHLVVLPAPGDGSLRAVLDWAADWARLPMSVDAPPWRASYFEGVTVDGVAGRMVSVTQTHHAMIDGHGGKRLAEHYLQWAPDGPLPELPELPTPEAITAWGRWKEGWALEGAKARQLVANTRRRLRRAGQDPRAGATRTKELVGAVRRFQSQQSPTPHSPLLRTRSDELRFDLVPVDLPALKAGAKALGGSVNDGFLAGLSLALHRYHLDHGLRVEELRTAMAMSTRSPVEGHRGNEVIGVMLALPLLDDAETALKQCREVARSHREDRDVLWLIDRFRAFANRLPTALVVKATRRTMQGIDLQVSNVQGIPLRHWVAGVEPLRTAPFPVALSSGVAMILQSSAGRAELGLTTDPATIKDPEHLIDRILEGFAEVAALAD